MGESIEAAERVRVVVRVRPPNDRELQQNSCHHTLTVDDEGGQIFVCKRKSEQEVERELRYSYDRVFNEMTNQSDVFDYLRDGVQQVAQGFNCTIFAYGQTGTGKTHTMLGQDLEHHLATTSLSPEAPESSPTWGVIPRAIESLFEELQSISRHGSAGVVHCSYMQIYNNDVYDLLQENKKRMKDPLAVREMIKGNAKQIYVSGLSEFRVTNLQETLQLLKTGNRNRAIRATTYNEKSSRSHALLQLAIEVESRGLESATTIIRRAKLNLVDLAGSEKWDSAVVTGSDRSKELTSINQSLSALGNVISALVNPKRTHIPYRDSKLTRLLQDSLGGNTRTVVIATISPSESAVDETISTLQFADRAKSVTIRVKVNELVDDAILLAQAQREISRLKLLLKQSGSHQQLSALEEQVARLTKEKTALVAENQKLRHTVASLRKTSSRKDAGQGEKTTPQHLSGKLRDNTAIVAAHSAPPANRNNVQGIDDRPSSALQLSQLRLDLKALGTKPVVITAFTDGNTENERLEQAAKAQELILQEIQTERRELERQLELLSHSGDNQRADSSGSGENLDGTEDPCPICGNDIDDHNDAELDRCIELEMNLIKQQHAVTAKPELLHSTGGKVRQQRPNSQSKRTTPGQVSGPRIRAAPRSATADPRLRRVSTSVHGKSSPYISNAVRKPSTPPQAKNGDDRTNGVSERQSKEAFIRSNTDVNNQRDSQSSPPPQIPIPILRQGHKGLRALKKFRATSPYNHAIPRKEKRTTLPVASVSTSSNSNGDCSHSIVNSVRDIGLELSVYKFRYDCWYNCTIVGFDRKRRMHCCQYDCGDKQWQDLSGHKVKVIGRSDNSR
ncbi:Kinesin protein [Phytophthora nicotianae]|uniref:Kinesin-like protein n=1 Tax=Phytophthora nicotianae TaxID=4792 RepID=A0A0W8CGE6_PHYNI|nr:Kinesin protein [Phytophthora nicotianae]